MLPPTRPVLVWPCVHQQPTTTDNKRHEITTDNPKKHLNNNRHEIKMKTLVGKRIQTTCSAKASLGNKGSLLRLTELIEQHHGVESPLRLLDIDGISNSLTELTTFS